MAARATRLAARALRRALGRVPIVHCIQIRITNIFTSCTYRRRNPLCTGQKLAALCSVYASAGGRVGGYQAKGQCPWGDKAHRYKQPLHFLIPHHRIHRGRSREPRNVTPRAFLKNHLSFSRAGHYLASVPPTVASLIISVSQYGWDGGRPS
jgi:hypothetical protein